MFMIGDLLFQKRNGEFIDDDLPSFELFQGWFIRSLISWKIVSAQLMYASEAGRGMVVVGLARRNEKVQELGEALSEFPAKLHPVECDISKAESILVAFVSIRDELGTVDVLVNNVGIAKETTFIGERCYALPSRRILVNAVHFRAYDILKVKLLFIDPVNLEDGQIMNESFNTNTKLIIWQISMAAICAHV